MGVCVNGIMTVCGIEYPECVLNMRLNRLEEFFEMSVSHQSHQHQEVNHVTKLEEDEETRYPQWTVDSGQWAQWTVEG